MNKQTDKLAARPSEEKTGKGIDGQADRLMRNQAGKQTGEQAGKQVEEQAEEQTGEQAEEQTGEQAEEQAGEQAEKQEAKQADEQPGMQAGKVTGRLAGHQQGRQPDPHSGQPAPAGPDAGKLPPTGPDTGFAAMVELNTMTLRNQAPAAIRQLCRSGAWRGPTAGLAHGHVQANLMILPREAAYDFLLFCQRNPKPCPLIEVVDAGEVMPACAAGGDLRFDVPGYRIYEHGELREEVDDIAAYWRDDLVSFLLGCSFSFESALIEGGVPLRHVEQGLNVAMYKTTIACQPAGRFAGNMVVSMRPVHCSLVPRAVTISARYPQVHGAPLHVGDPAALGITDLSRPDFGDAVDLRDDELPVFWACGVTPQYVAQLARIPFCISHSPGKMLVTDFKTE